MTEKTFQRKTTAEAAVTPIDGKRTQKSELEKELSERRRGLEGIDNTSPKNYEALKTQSENVERLLFEAGALEKGITAIDEEIETLELQEKSDVRASILQKAEVLAEEKKSLLARLLVIDAEGQKLREEFEINTPRKRIQTESHQLLKWQRTIQEDRIGGFSWRGEPLVTKAEPHREETVSDGMPYRIKALQEAGWHLIGQEIVSEELTQANSRLVPMIATPEIFGDFV